MLKYCKDDYPTLIDFKIVVLVGLLAGCVFWIKYTLLGIFFAWMAFLFFITWIQNGLESGLKLCVIFITAMLASSIPWIIYFSCQHALGDLWDIYFYNNLFAYSTIGGIFNKIEFLIVNLFLVIRRNKLLSVLGFLGILGLLRGKYKITERIFLISGILCTYIFIYIGGRSYLYYPLPLFLFSITGFITIVEFIEKKHKLVILVRKSYMAGSFFVALMCINYGIHESCNMYLISEKRENMWMYNFAEQIPKSATLLNYDNLDLGLYTVTGKIPTNKYFCRLNIDDKNMLDAQRQSVLQGETDYVVMRLELDEKVPEHIFNKYEIAMSKVGIQDGREFRFYLFELIDLGQT